MKHRVKGNAMVKMKFSAFEERCVNPYSRIKEEKPLVILSSSCCSIARFAKNVKNKKHKKQ